MIPHIPTPTETERKMALYRNFAERADKRPFAVYAKEVTTKEDLHKPWTRVCSVNFRRHAEVISARWHATHVCEWTFVTVNEGKTTMVGPLITS
jgi:hypothetical protein